MNLRDELAEIRKVSTPWVAIATNDYRDTIATVLRVAAEINDNSPVPAACYDCVNGALSPVTGANGEKLSAPVKSDLGTPDDPPFRAIQKAMTGLPDGGVYFVIITDAEFLKNPFTIQAVSDCREPFKASGRTLVLLGVNVQLPEFLAEDVPLLEDPLPDHETLGGVVKKLAEDGGSKVGPADIDKAATACLGMTRFAAEEAVARKLRKSGINLQGLGEARQRVIEEATNRALVFEKERWTFDQIGGLGAFKGFMTNIFGGPKKPSLVVRIDEIDKSITAASTGTVADNTGVSQDILKTLLTTVEDNGWMGLLAVGGPGTGKTLASVCTGNQFDVRTLAMDLGAVKGSLVGETEGKIRRVMQVIKSVGGRNVLFMATCNRLDTLPPELQRRFWLGTWFWDLPTKPEREAIWKIQRERFKIDPKDRQPDDDDWTGSDIKNACQMAWACRATLKEAAEWITIAGVVSKTQIDALRALAEKSGFRSASQPGAYKNKARTGRRLGELN